eukprot:gene604-332_t
MSNALTVLENGSRVLLLQKKLLVAIHLHGTIAQVSDFRPAAIKPRPYLSYLVNTLHKLNCDVHLITSLNPQSDSLALNAFLHQTFGPMPYHVHFEAPQGSTSSLARNGSSPSHSWNRTGASAGEQRGGGSAATPLASRNFMPLLRQRAVSLMSHPDNILFVDAEVNYRFTPLQTVVMEKFVHYTTRQKRRDYRAYVGEEIARHMPPGAPGESQSSNTFVSRHEAQAQRMAGETAFLAHEQAVLREREEWARKQQKEMEEMEKEEQEENEGAAASPGSSTNKGGNDKHYPGASRDCGTLVSYQKPLPSSLVEDFTCVALATLLAELAASTLTVKTFLRREVVLLEPLRIPMHEECFYLAKDNCEDLEMVDWDEVQVMEAKAEERRQEEVGPRVKETAEHASMFQ